MKASNVFTPGKSPDITFIDDQLKDKSTLLLDALEIEGAVVSLSGPSKSGKTVFIEKTLGKDVLIQVTGAGVNNPNTLWNRVLDLIGVSVSNKTTKQDGFKGNIKGKVSAGVNFIASGKGEVETSGDWSKSKSSTKEFSPDYLQLITKNLGGTKYVIFIDDFHYIPRSIQIEISNQIKEAVREKVFFVCASVPYHSDDVIRANPDLRGRIVNIDFNYWDIEALKKIAARGFNALNVRISGAVIDAFASEAAGSPQLMQALCLYACYEENIREVNEKLVHIQKGMILIEKVCTRTATMTDYSSTVEKLRDGPKIDIKENKQYLLKDETISNIYNIILKSIALNPPELNIRYPNLISRVKTVCKNNIPSTSAIFDACERMSLVANQSENMVVMEWDNDADVLDIRDPYFLFYLRWACD